MLCVEAANTNFIFFGFTQPQLEHTIYNTRASTLTITQPLIQSWILGKKEMRKCFWRPTHNRSFMQSFSSNGPVMFVESIEMWKVVLNLRLRKKNLCLNHSTSSKKNYDLMLWVESELWFLRRFVHSLYLGTFPEVVAILH